MNTDQQIPEDHETPDEPTGTNQPEASGTNQAAPDDERSSRRPFGFWLKVVDRRLSDEMERLFEADGITRRDWRVLNLIAGEARDEELARRLRHRPDKLARLVDRGWVEHDHAADADAQADTVRLTADGSEARERLLAQVRTLRERVAGAVSPEDFATTVATLEAIARELGWDESDRAPRGRRGGRRFGHRGFGPGLGFPRGFGREPGFGPGYGHGHPGRPVHPGRAGFEPELDAGEHRGHAPHPGHPGHPGHPHQDVHVHVHLHERGTRHGSGKRGHGAGHDRRHGEGEGTAHEG